MHICIQVIEVVFWFLCTCACYRLLICTCAYRPDELLPGCSSTFNLLSFPPEPDPRIYIYIYICTPDTEVSEYPFFERKGGGNFETLCPLFGSSYCCCCMIINTSLVWMVKFQKTNSRATEENFLNVLNF